MEMKMVIPTNLKMQSCKTIYSNLFVGEVANPRILKIPRTTLSILAAGGPKDNRANLNNVELIRAE